ncbi:MAG: NADH-quinone oxidoreductase subunit NuoK [Acidobacteriota bacterium]|nr:NADH-quinone oxidoreductase subunit NuoK [Blastocatellia bacterium]MDW8412761.1 NADH-quinone oxidoreductase subunit NuoK [Acidobacteriota bacterium]
MVPLSWYLVLSAVLFTLGAVGLFVKRNIISIFMCIELMLNAVNLSLVAFSSFLKHLDGQLFVFMVMVVAAAEAGVGLALIISVFRNRESVDIDKLNLLKM